MTKTKEQEDKKHQKPEKFFRLHVPYFLSTEIVKDIEVGFGTEEDHEKSRESKIPFHQFYNWLSDHQISDVEDSTRGLKLTADGVRYIAFVKSSFFGQVIKVLGQLKERGFPSRDSAPCRKHFPVLLGEAIEKGYPLDCEWFFTNFDTSMTDPHHVFHFFIVYDNVIALEEANLFFSPIDDEWVDVLKANENGESPWIHDERSENARITWLYRRFYTETPRGQILAIRDSIFTGPAWQNGIISMIISSVSSMKWIFWAIIGIIFVFKVLVYFK